MVQKVPKVGFDRKRFSSFHNAVVLRSDILAFSVCLGVNLVTWVSTLHFLIFLCQQRIISGLEPIMRVYSFKLS